jgi:5-methylcytosine-specific restriction endonuclease McrA
MRWKPRPHNQFLRIAAYLKIRRARAKARPSWSYYRCPEKTQYEKRAQLADKWKLQNGRCFYCRKETWLLSETIVGMSRHCRNHMATREHLKRKCEGGGDENANIVMACASCNNSRGDKSVKAHLVDVRAAISRTDAT